MITLKKVLLKCWKALPQGRRHKKHLAFQPLHKSFHYADLPKGMGIRPQQADTSKVQEGSRDGSTHGPRVCVYQKGWSETFAARADVEFVVQGCVFPVHSAFLKESQRVQDCARMWSFFGRPQLKDVFEGVEVKDMDAFLCQVYQDPDPYHKNLATNALGIVRIARILQCNWVADSVVVYLNSKLETMDKKGKKEEASLEKFFLLASAVMAKIVSNPHISVGAAITCGVLYYGGFALASKCCMGLGLMTATNKKYLTKILIKVGSLCLGYLCYWLKQACSGEGEENKG